VLLWLLLLGAAVLTTCPLAPPIAFAANNHGDVNVAEGRVCPLSLFFNDTRLQLAG